MTAEELKTLFSQPLMLLVLMVLGSFISAAKQLIVARKQGTPISLSTYFLKVESLVMIVGVFFTWLGLIFFDTLNVVTALGGGYIINDAADVATKEGRSAAINPPTEAKKDAP